VRDKRLLGLIEDVCREATAVGKAEGAHVDEEELATSHAPRREADGREPREHAPGFGRHRRTEIDAITGSIVRAAQRHRIPVPLNASLYALRAGQGSGVPRGFRRERSRPKLIKYYLNPLCTRPVVPLLVATSWWCNLAKIKMKRRRLDSLGEELDLQAIALALGGAEYEPEQFPGLTTGEGAEDRDAPVPKREGRVHRGEEPRARTRPQSTWSQKQIEGRHPDQKESVIEVQNIVASWTSGPRFNLNAIAISLGLEKVDTEPEQSPDSCTD